MPFRFSRRHPASLKGPSGAGEPTVLGEFGGADQGGDGEAVPGADRQASPAAGHAAGAAAQRHALVRFAVVVAGGGQRQVAAHVLHALAVTLGRSRRVGRVISRPVMSEHRQSRGSAAQMLRQDGDSMLLFAFFIQSRSVQLKKRRASGDHHQ